jgi:hypothetical protein
MGSVHNEISRLETAKSDIEAAIEACGVPVPDTELISTYATYIRQIPSAVFSELNYDPVGGGDTYIKTIKQTNGLIEATTGGLVSTSQSGLTPKIENAAAAAIATQADEWVLTSNKGDTPTWKRLPSNAFNNNYRPISVGGTSILGNNNTALNLVAGTNISITPEKNSSDKYTGKVTITNTGVRSITTGDNNGTIKVDTGGSTQNVAVAGLGSAAYTSADNYYSSTTKRNANTVLAGPTSGASASAIFRALVAADIPSLSSNKITALTGYSKATSASDLTSSDTLNTALGKLEYKADTVYKFMEAANDEDGTIENLKEVLDVLSGISDTDTIQALVGKYLPLTGGTVTGELHANVFHINTNNFSLDNSGTFWIGVDTTGELFRTDKGWYNSYRILDSSNYTTYTVKKDGTGATGTWNIDINGTANNASKLGNKGLAWWNGITSVSSSGVLEIGKYIDFHNSSDSTNNYDCRIQCTGTDQNILSLPKTSGTLALVSNIPTKISQLENDGSFLTPQDFASTELTSNLVTIEKTIAVTKDWMDTGIDGDDFDTGTYIIQVSCASDSVGFYDCYWSGVMSWWKGRTNDTQTDEIVLHRSGRSYTNTIYLRTVMRNNTDANGLKLQISANTGIGSCKYTFKFKKLI